MIKWYRVILDLDDVLIDTHAVLKKFKLDHDFKLPKPKSGIAFDYQRFWTKIALSETLSEEFLESYASTWVFLDARNFLEKLRLCQNVGQIMIASKLDFDAIPDSKMDIKQTTEVYDFLTTDKKSSGAAKYSADLAKKKLLKLKYEVMKVKLNLISDLDRSTFSEVVSKGERCLAIEPVFTGNGFPKSQLDIGKTILFDDNEDNVHAFNFNRKKGSEAKLVMIKKTEWNLKQPVFSADITNNTLVLKK